MINLKVVFQGKTINISGDPNIEIQGVQGLDLPDAMINSSQKLRGVGATIVNKAIRPRTIVISACPRYDVSAGRDKIYDTFPVGSEVDMIFTTNGKRMRIAGTVESVKSDLFDQVQILQITIICPFPYFRDMDNSFRESFPLSSSITVQGQRFSDGTEIEIISEYAFKRVEIYQNALGYSRQFVCELTNSVQALFIRSFSEKKAVVGHSIDVVEPYSDWISLERGSNGISIALFRLNELPEGEQYIEFSGNEYDESSVIFHQPIYYGGV